MKVETACLTECAVLWTPQGYDRKGEPTYGSPVEIRVRWELRTDAQVTNQQDPFAKPTTLFVDRHIPINSRVWAGRLSDLPANPSPLFIVKNLTEIPDIKGIEVQRTATLQRV